MSAEPTWDAIVERLAGDPEIDVAKAFSSPGLRIRRKIFAMYVRGDLVVKLPAERCAELVDGGGARIFESGGRRMREWIVIDASREGDWPALADEALAYGRELTA